jgi:hypothetical protein
MKNIALKKISVQKRVGDTRFARTYYSNLCVHIYRHIGRRSTYVDRRNVSHRPVCVPFSVKGFLRDNRGERVDRDHEEIGSSCAKSCPCSQTSPELRVENSPS